MLKATEAINITTQVVSTFFDTDNVTTSSNNTSDVIKGGNNVAAVEWLKKFELIATPILLLLGRVILKS